jgi:DNA recombination protein Rad52
MLNKAQHDALLKGLNPKRISTRKGAGNSSLSYLEAWDVKAHLNRIFGFLNWSADVVESTLAFEEQKDGKWSVGYKVTLRLTIFSDPEGYNRVTYTEAAVGSSTQGQRGEAHDMAVKTAESDALKRAAINLGDQFGLSLYNNGSTAPVVLVDLSAGPVPEETPNESA